MREIKFRYLEDGKFRYIVPQKPGDDLQGWHILVEGAQEFVGLKDKNGKEIYEGDILRNANLKTLLIVTYTKYEDIVLGLFSGFFLQNVKNKTLEHHLSMRDMEIIGNIHENPELLK